MAKKENTIRFAKKTLERLPLPQGKDRPVYHDDLLQGLQLRITSQGTITFFVQKRDVNQVNQKITIGRFPSWTVEQARDRAYEIFTDLAQGINPNQLKAESLSKRNITLQKVFKDYQRSRGTNLEQSTIKGYKSIIDNQLGDWKKLPISEIKQSIVETRFFEITHGTGKFFGTDGSPTRANTMIRVLRALYNYAMVQYVDSREEPLILHNPTKIISHNKSWNREKSRIGVVENYKLKDWYEGIMKLPEHDKNTRKTNSSEVARDVFIFLLFTGLRRNEALELKWEDIDFKDNSFTIEDTKNHECHKMPLTWILLEILERRKNDNGNPYVFEGEKPNSHLSPPKKQIEKARELIGFHFTNHDLRRTFTTTANRLNFNKYVLDRLINHKNSEDSRDVTKRYVILDVEDLREPMNQITDSIWSQIQ
jgi:integrase